MGISDAPRIVPLRRNEYERLVEAGLLDEQHVELLAGRKVAMSPESAEHAAVVDAVADQLAGPARQAGLRVRVGHPVALSDIDEPEPDIAVVTDRPDRYRRYHPQPADVHLVVEVAHRSLGKDLGEKVRRYAAAAIPEYWVVDLAGRRTLVQRDPDPADGSFRSVQAVAFGTPMTPLALPAASVTVT